MKITILTFGTRGDIEPCLALAARLNHAGHTVTLVAPAAFGDWIRSYGVFHYPLSFDFSQLRPILESKSKAGFGHAIKNLRKLKASIVQGARKALDEYWAASTDADFILQTGYGHGGVEIAEKLDIPMAFAYLSLFPNR